MGSEQKRIPLQVEPVASSDEFLKGLWRQNPVFVQVLGMCPTLAVTNSVINALAMGLATCFVLLMSSIMVATLRNFIPRQVRIACYISIIATFVTSVDYILQAISLSLHAALGAFVPLIVVNCLILGRAEAFASKNTVYRSVLDGFGMGLGFTWALLVLGLIREVLGNGSILGVSIFPAQYEPWTIMLLPSGGFFTLGVWLLFANWLKQRESKLAKLEDSRVMS